MNFEGSNTDSFKSDFSCVTGKKSSFTQLKNYAPPWQIVNKKDMKKKTAIMKARREALVCGDDNAEDILRENDDTKADYS